MPTPRPYMIVAIFTGAFLGMAWGGFDIGGLVGAAPGIVGLILQIPFVFYLRRKLANA